MSRTKWSSNFQECSAGGDNESAETKSAGAFCVDCSERLCEECVSAHRQQKETREHKFVKISDIFEEYTVRVSLHRARSIVIRIRIKLYNGIV